jgi:hypothetical protein
MEESVQHSEIEGIQMQCEVHVRQEHHHGKRYENVKKELLHVARQYIHVTFKPCVEILM